MYKKTMREALREARAYRDPVNEDKGFSSQQIKMAYGVLNDPRYKQGNYSGAFKAIEKIAKGLASHPDVANALKRANEELEEANKSSKGPIPNGNFRFADERNFKFVVNYAKTDKYDNSQAFFNNQSDAEKFVKALKDQGFNHFYRLKNPANEELEEAMKLKYDKGKEGWYDEKGRRRYLSIGATNAIMRKKLDHAIKTGDWTDFNKEELETGEQNEKTV